MQYKFLLGLDSGYTAENDPYSDWQKISIYYAECSEFWLTLNGDLLFSRALEILEFNELLVGKFLNKKFTIGFQPSVLSLK